MHTASSGRGTSGRTRRGDGGGIVRASSITAE
jgi:hypothetical protein